VTDGTRELRLVVTAPDYDAALRFYRDVLGLREEAAFTDDNGGRAAVLHAGRATIELGDDAHADAIDKLEVGHRIAGPVRLAFEVGDAEETTQRLVSAGARLVAAPVRTPWGSVNARLDGPDGQHLTVYSKDVYVAERPRLDGQVLLAEADPSWRATAGRLMADIRAALGSRAPVLLHAGSTSVPGLEAKPVIDLVLGVPDPGDEARYVPALEPLGYRLRLREPEWHEHRLLRPDDSSVNLHVFAAGSTEIDRMLAFREHLRRDGADRALYQRSKQELAARTWEYTQGYADAKSDVVADIMTRALARNPEPPAGWFVMVTDPVAGEATARELAGRLRLPLVSWQTVHGAFGEGRGAVHIAERVLFAVAADSAGAVIAVPSTTGRAHQVAGLPGSVLEIACDAEPPDDVDWPVVAYRSGDVLADIEPLTRLVRQMTAGA